MDDFGYTPEEEQAWCTECRDRCSVVIEDHGIGPFEYGHSCETHVNLIEVSSCCSAPISRDDLTEYLYED